MWPGFGQSRANLRYHKPVDYVCAAQGITTDPVDDDVYIDDPFATLVDVVNEDADMKGLVYEDYDAGADGNTAYGDDASADTTSADATDGDVASADAANADAADGNAASADTANADATADADVATEAANPDYVHSRATAPAESRPDSQVSFGRNEICYM
ncbi:hypothetical protein PInf_002735 [Phytophthora infestans]|nr:hypothetical protein PInf_002735 [Phytophthora infestans]